MRLLRVHVIKADTCGGLLDGLDIDLRNIDPDEAITSPFAPLCLIGPNGAGKSQFLQVLAEIFQSIFHATVSHQERVEGNKTLQFEIEYLIKPLDTLEYIHVQIIRQAIGRRKSVISIQKSVDGEWIDCELSSDEARVLLPHKIVGYTSGDNETLSLPFLLSRSGYADEVREHAFLSVPNQGIEDTRLMLIDYATHLEVLVANLIFNTESESEALLLSANLKSLHSFRCIIQLAHGAVSKASARRNLNPFRKGIQLTEELETYLRQLQDCATCYDFDSKTETYTFDFYIDEKENEKSDSNKKDEVKTETQKAFDNYWIGALDLYSAFHKLAMLNDLAIPKHTRERFKKDSKARRFASRLPEPQDEDKVFRFEQVKFRSNKSSKNVDYVSLSDGEHQLVQLLGTFSMISSPNVLFLLDEPESHFNPLWRVKFISRLMELPTSNGMRESITSLSKEQECLLTTHAPFVPSDMQSDNVFIFSKDPETKFIQIAQPGMQTYGATFDAILGECFGIRPPMSQLARNEIDKLMKSQNEDAIREGIERLGNSVDKIILMDKLRQISKNK
jgi:restriction system-associated AAA family ATPase